MSFEEDSRPLRHTVLYTIKYKKKCLQKYLIGIITYYNNYKYLYLCHSFLQCVIHSHLILTIITIFGIPFGSDFIIILNIEFLDGFVL